MVFEDGVEAPEKSFIQQFFMVRSCDNQRFPLILLQELQEGVEDSSDFAHVIFFRPFGSKGINLIEQVHTARFSHGIKHQPELGGCFPHEFRNHGMEEY